MKYEIDEQALMGEFAEGARQAFARSGQPFRVAGPNPICMAPISPEDPGCEHVHAEDLLSNRHLDEIPRDFYEHWPGWTAQRRD